MFNHFNIFNHFSKHHIRSSTQCPAKEFSKPKFPFWEAITRAGHFFFNFVSWSPQLCSLKFLAPKGLISKIQFLAHATNFQCAHLFLTAYKMGNSQPHFWKPILRHCQFKSYEDCKFSKFLVPIKPDSWDTWASHLFPERSLMLPTSWPSFQYRSWTSYPTPAYVAV